MTSCNYGMDGTFADLKTRFFIFLPCKVTSMSQLFRFPNTLRHDPDVTAWLNDQYGELGALAQHWFDIIRNCGAEVHELLHDNHPTACVDDAAFAYVNVFKAHVNVGFFLGAELPDPSGLLEGKGKYMRHVKLKPNRKIDEQALISLIEAAYADTMHRLTEE